MPTRRGFVMKGIVQALVAASTARLLPDLKDRSKRRRF
jgi:hypothetical protein